MALGRQLAVYCLDVAVITVASLVRLTSIAAVAYGSYRDIAYLKGAVVSGLAVLSPPTEQRDTGRAHGWSNKRQLHLHDGVTCGSHSAS